MTRKQFHEHPNEHWIDGCLLHCFHQFFLYRCIEKLACIKLIKKLIQKGMFSNEGF